MTAHEAGGHEDPSPEVLTEAAGAFGLLASPARLHVVWALAQGECDVTRLAERVGGALPAISQHLAKLKLAGLVGSRREGRRQVYWVTDPDVVHVVRHLIERRAEAAAAPVPAPAARAAGARPWTRAVRGLRGVGE
ncbi:ArsR/SmtB family transcription factor (plasmid) [Streptomyces sp. BI20]|uniref:ArsR/SmtB family transcription factor n=1 Tax=Streptomyces sp. BI20 TaxID=3403460 RepID=UPI003C707EC3